MKDTINISELTQEEKDEFFADTAKLPFNVIRKLASGKEVTAPFDVNIDPNGIEGTHLTRYRKRVAEISVETHRLKTQAEANEVAGEVDPDSGAEVEPKIIDEALEMSLMLELQDVNDQYVVAEAELLANLVTGCTYPGKDFTDAQVLCQREGAGPAARRALHAYFFGSSDAPEAETGNTETPNSESASDSLAPTETAELTPPTS